MGDARGGHSALVGKRLLEVIVSVGTVGRRRESKVFGVGNGAGSGSRLLRLENGKMGPDVVPEDPNRLEKEKSLKKSIVEGTQDRD